MIQYKQLETFTNSTILDLALEEASELIHAICKARRFGLTLDNFNHLCDEHLQVSDYIRFLHGRLGINYGETLERHSKETHR